MADRILVLSSNPGRIRAEIPNSLTRPRDRRSPDFEALVDHLYGVMTGRETPEPSPVATEPEPASPLTSPLPHAGVGGLAGLLEIVEARNGRADLPELASFLSFEVDDLLPLTDAAELLGFATVHDADLILTDVGREWFEADILRSKSLFADAARNRAPLVRTIVRALSATKDGSLGERFFLDILGRGFPEGEARAQLDVAIDWGRYGELFDYESDSGELSLTLPESP